MYYPFFDPTLVILIPAVIMAIWAQTRVRSVYRKYNRIDSSSGMSGADVARRILQQEGLEGVRIEAIKGDLTDHYNPRSKKVRLSETVYYSESVAALGIAAHEVGHAVQHARGNTALKIRHAFLLPANIGSTLAFPMFFVGFIFSSFNFLMDLGIALFVGALAFQLITLPVEFDASRRALAALSSTGIMTDNEVDQAREVLRAASWTYVAAATMALTQLLRLIVLRGDGD